MTVQPLNTVGELAQRLRDAGIAHCHWKSNEAIDRSATADNDLDLLVARADEGLFSSVLNQLGFKQARPPRNREMPGLLDLYGMDAPTGKLVHVQAHYQLVLGDDMTKNFRLPVERHYLDSATPTDLFPLPAPDFELAIFVVRMVLKHAAWDAQLSQLGRLSQTEQRELDYLRSFEHDPSTLAKRLPLLPPELVGQCYDVVCSPTSGRERARVARALESALTPFARRPRTMDQVLRIGRRATRVAAKAAARPARKRLVAGGSTIAVAGDEAGAADLGSAVARWLDPVFPVRTFSAADGPGRPLRHAANGGISICVGWPAELHDAVDLLIVVGADHRESWAHPDRLVVDADRPREALAEVRSAIWARL